jgi:hypothetical protein
MIHKYYYNWYQLSLEGENAGRHHETSAPNANADPVDPLVQRK